ncbi:MAG: polysaccharide deacetylase family protein [Planctomycetota bacterium]
MALIPRIVLYHDVCSDPGDAVRGLGVSTPVELFREHIEWFCEHYTPISLAQLRSGELDLIATRKRPPLLITFDDCYRSVPRVAGPILKKLGVPALFFVNSAPIVDRRPLLDNLLCLIAACRGLRTASSFVAPDSAPAETIGELVGARVSGLSYGSRQSLIDRLVGAAAIAEARAIMDSDVYCDLQDLAACKDYGIDLGNHTHSHPHMRCLDAADFDLEIGTPGKLVHTELSGYADAFSVPYGSREDATPAILDSLDRQGVRDVFLVHSVRNRAAPTAGAWYRTSLVRDPVSSLRKRIEWLPRIRQCRDAIRKGAHR